MVKITKEAALAYHEGERPGKIEVKPTKPYRTQTDLSLAYSPGVAYPCLEIQSNPNDAYRYTDKGNLVAVISNGTAVLGLGDIGAISGKPVMEGKGLLFKIYGGIDVFDIELDEKDPEKFCETVERIAPTFEVYHGVNIKDSALVAAATLSDRYITSRFLPDKAIDLVDEACATIKVQMDSVPVPLDTLTRQIMQLEVEKEALKKERDDISKNRLQEIDNDLKDLKAKEQVLRKDWEEEKKINDQISKKKEEIESSRFKLEQAENNYANR